MAAANEVKMPKFKTFTKLTSCSSTPQLTIYNSICYLGPYSFHFPLASSKTYDRYYIPSKVGDQYHVSMSICTLCKEIYRSHIIALILFLVLAAKMNQNTTSLST